MVFSQQSDPLYQERNRKQRSSFGENVQLLRNPGAKEHAVEAEHGEGISVISQAIVDRHKRRDGLRNAENLLDLVLPAHVRFKSHLQSQPNMQYRHGQRVR